MITTITTCDDCKQTIPEQRVWRINLLDIDGDVMATKHACDGSCVLRVFAQVIALQYDGWSIRRP